MWNGTKDLAALLPSALPLAAIPIASLLLGSCAARPEPPPSIALVVEEVPDAEYEAVLEPSRPRTSPPAEELAEWPPAEFEGKQYVEVRTTTHSVPDSWSKALLHGSSSTALLLEERTAREVLRALEERADSASRRCELSVADGRSGSVHVVDQRSFVRGYHYVSLPGAKMPEPEVAVVEEGEILRIEARIEDEHTVHLELEISHRELEPMLEHVARPRPRETLRLEVPIVKSEHLRTRTSVELDQILLLRRPGFAEGERWTFVGVNITSGPPSRADGSAAPRTAAARTAASPR